MAEQLSLEKPQAKAIQLMDPMQMIQIAFQTAIERGEGLEVVDRILAQQREMIAYQDRLAFQASLQRMQAKLKIIAKRGDNPDTHSKFATAFDIDAEIQPLLVEEKMSLTFEPRPSEKPDMVLIVGILSLGGYSREYPLEMPADGKGAKGGGVMSRTHATGSAITYGKRYLKNMIFDLRFKEKDDDGNKAGGNSGEMPDETLQGWLDSMRQASTHEELRKLYGDAYRAAEKLGDRDAMDSIIRVKDAVKKGLK